MRAPNAMCCSLCAAAARSRTCGASTRKAWRTRLAFALCHRAHRCSAQLERLQASLTSLDPYAVLARGYSITRNGAGEVLRDAAQAREGEDILTTLARGALQSKVKMRELL